MRWARRGLSAFLLFHLVSVLLFPNSDNSTGMALAPVIRPYVHLFEMTNAWNFFAPHPEPPIYVEYELLDGEGGTIRKASWPEKSDPFWIRDRQNRRITAADFMIADETRAQKMMVPYLCGLAERPHSVKLWRVMYNTPTAQEVAQGKRVLGDEVGLDRRYAGHSFCPGEGS